MSVTVARHCLVADRARFAAMRPLWPAEARFPDRLPNPAEVAAACRRTADLYAAHERLMPAVW